ncbi:tripartite motif-containing protein 2-like [Branchiostoma floridae x Branchiostoma japonicum]
MASNMPDDFDEQFLVCPVCMRHFRDPRVLPCLHTFCRECLQEWATKQQPLEPLSNNNSHCPTCRTQVSLPDQGVDGLRTNFYVSNLLDFAAAKKGAEPGVPCQVCKRSVEGSKSWCADCAVLMCESCTLLHRSFPCSKDHEVTTEETLKAEGGISTFHSKRHCDKHRNQELVFYCESCNALVCTACTVVDHRPGKDHNPVEITTVSQKKKETIQALLQDIDPRLKEMQTSIKEIDRKVSNLTPSKETATEQAKTYFRKLADLLQKREKEILSQIDEQCRADGKALQTKKEAIEFELVGLTSAQTFCQQAVQHGSDVHILEVGKQVQARVETLLAKQLDLESDWSDFQFVENTDVRDFEKEVQDLGGVKTKIDAPKCEVVLKPAVPGFECIAELATMNPEGRPCVTNSKAVTADMKDPSGTDVPTQLQMKGWGVWELSYVPKVTGSHRLEVKVNSQQVPGSPFEVEVKGNPVLTIGRKGSGVGELDLPVGVAVDKDGNIAVVERGNKRVQIFDKDTGQSLRSFPVDGEKPYDLDVDSNGMFVVTSWGEHFGLRRYTKEGKLLDTFKPDCMDDPHGLTVLKDGRMVVVNRPEQSSCLLLLQPDGSLLREIGKGQLQKPVFVSVDESRDTMFVTDKRAHKVFAFDLDGNPKFEFGKEGQNDGDFQNPKGITVDPAGNVIVGNGGDGRVQVFRANGAYIRTIGTVETERASGVTLTSDGYIAVACWNGHCIELYRYM